MCLKCGSVLECRRTVRPGCGGVRDPQRGSRDRKINAGTGLMPLSRRTSSMARQPLGIGGV